MWNLIFNPSENGAALLPVSRDWNFAPSPANDDWTYAVFDWWVGPLLLLCVLRQPIPWRVV